MPRRSEQHEIAAELAERRKSCGPLAQLLRRQYEAERAMVIVCRGGLEIDAHGLLWHRDCPSTGVGRVMRAGHDAETLA